MSDYTLNNRVQFIINTLNFDKDIAEENMKHAFCKIYGEQADEIDKFKTFFHKRLDKIPYVFGLNYQFIADNLLHKGGLYAMYSEKKCLYIGKSTDLSMRIPSSYSNIKQKCCHYDKGHYWVDTIKYLIIPNKGDIDILELLYIAKYKPLFNRDCNSKQTSLLPLFSSEISIRKFSTIPER